LLFLFFFFWTNGIYSNLQNKQHSEPETNSPGEVQENQESELIETTRLGRVETDGPESASEPENEFERQKEDWASNYGQTDEASWLPEPDEAFVFYKRGIKPWAHDPNTSSITYPSH
jgi:hypothetical protein